MYNWRYLLDTADVKKYCDTLQKNCIAKLRYEGAFIIGFISARGKTAFFCHPQSGDIISRNCGFFILEDNGSLEWSPFVEGNMIPARAVCANPLLNSNRLYFGCLAIPNEHIFGAVLDSGMCCFPLEQSTLLVQPDAILVRKISFRHNDSCIIEIEGP
ncbi:Hypothetical predicted protein [Cloeon dipterum]|uniref:Uncharacterized protein n=1 Tax=Cloeon dipterum TaxID=197152 RepID=A0A8S1DA21_9INSE|nr:Hypothetical predicted protein [Cloeon dipterum]